MNWFIPYLKKELGALVLITVFVGLLSSQQINFNALTVEDGLSQHDVSSIIQDSEGFIWIGTYDGLNRYDGYEIEAFMHDNNNKNSLSSNRVKCLLEDKENRIWIGTDGYGLNYYDLEENTITRVPTPQGFEIINHIIQDTNGDYIVATTQGILRIDYTQENTPFVEIVPSPLTGLNVKHLVELTNGAIIYATNKGLWIQNTKGFHPFEGSASNIFNWVIETSSGQVWAGGAEGLYTVKNKILEKKDDILSDNVLTIIEGINSDLWVSTFNSGLYNINLENQEATRINTASKDITADWEPNTINYLFKDATNTLWISNKKGLLYSNLNVRSFKSLPIAKKGHVRTLFVTDTHAYYGYQSDQFYVYSFSEETNSAIYLSKYAKPFKIDTLNGQIYLATTRGLYKQGKQGKQEFELESVFGDLEKDTSIIYTCFSEDSHGNRFYGTFKGLILKSQDFTGWAHEKYKNLENLRDVRIFSLKVDEANKCLWVGTISKGIIRINFGPSGNVLSAEHYNEQMVGAYNIPNNSIWCFYKTENGNLYVGTDTGLLVKKPNENTFQLINSIEVQNKKIMGIIEDDEKNIWMTNSQGIIKYDPKTEKTEKYSYENGLMTTTFTEAVSRNKNGELFFGSISGVNYFKSDELKINPFSSKIALTNLIVNNAKVEVKESLSGSVLLNRRLNRANRLEFNHKQNDFTIEFTSTNYSNVKVNKYRYKLDGYDQNWITVENNKRYASYSNIPAGNYTFYVEALNPNGEWSEEVKVLPISVKAAPWNTWWAYAIYFIMVSALIVFIFKSILHRQKLKNQIALSNLKNEQDKEINEMKLMFFTDVAHEFKTPLSLVIGPLNDLIRGKISNEHKEFCYGIISRNTNRMMNLVNQLLDFRKINSGVNILKVSRNDICEFIREIAKSFEWQSKNANIRFNIISPDSYFCHFDKDIIEKVMYNLLSNAFKYTPKNGIIELELKPTWKQDLEYFLIVLKDSGTGIPQMDKKKIFDRHFHGKDRSSSGIGLHLTATLLEAHRAEINVLNSSLGGTEFMVTLPVSSKAFTEDEFLLKEDIPTSLPYDYIPGEPLKEQDFEKESNKEKILIVEDDYDLRKYLFNILNRDHLVFEATNGKEGLELALDEIPDIIISDVMMPTMDGIEMCRAIKENTLISHIPIIMLTAKTGEEFQTKGLEVGAWDYIAKPFDSTQLLQKVKNIIETRNNFRKHLSEGATEKTNKHYISYDQKFVSNTTSIIEKHISNPNFTVENLSEELGLSRMQLHRKLKSLTGLNTTAFINSIKVRIAINMFDSGCDRVQEAMDATGINSYAHFNSLFKKEKGVTPSKYIDLLKQTAQSQP